MFKKVFSLKTKDLLFLLCSYIIIITLAIIFKVSIIATMSSLFGMTAVIYNSSGKKICFLFYIIHCILYAIQSFISKMYGELIIYSIYLTPLYFISFIDYIKGKVNSNNDIRFLNIKTLCLIIALITTITVCYGFVLKAIDSTLPFFNSLLTALTITCGFLTAKRYYHQWFLWLFLCVAAITTWSLTLKNDMSGLAFVLQNSLCIILNINGLLAWNKMIKENNIKKQ